jgi:hypothetical protein
MDFKLQILPKCILNLGFTNIHLCAYIGPSMSSMSRTSISQYSFCLISWILFVEERKLLWNFSLRKFGVSIHIIMACSNHCHLFRFYKLCWSVLCTELSRYSFENHRNILSTVCDDYRCCKTWYACLMSCLQIHWLLYPYFFPPWMLTDTKITLARVTVQLNNLEGKRTVRLYRDTEL